MLSSGAGLEGSLTRLISCYLVGLVMDPVEVLLYFEGVTVRKDLGIIIIKKAKQ